jgi:hypothetical protein
MATRKKTTAEPVKTDAVAPVVFTKQKVLTFKRYANRRDLLSVLLKDGKEYTIEQVDSLINEFMTKKKGKVK